MSSTADYSLQLGRGLSSYASLYHRRCVEAVPKSLNYRAVIKTPVPSQKILKMKNKHSVNFFSILFR